PFPPRSSDQENSRMSEPTRPSAVAAPPHAAHEVHHEELGFWRKYVFSTDHKVIGIQYAVTGLLFLLFGFTLMMLMRWNLAYPGAAVPWLGTILGDSRMPGGTMLPEFYNQLGAMHGTIMVFLRVVPLAVLRASIRHRGLGTDVVARRDDLLDHLVAARSGQFHHDHDPAPRQRAH